MVKINITLKFINIICCSTIIKIFDENDNLLYEKETNNGMIKVYLKRNKGYKLIVRNGNQILMTSFYVDCINKFVFSLNSIVNNSVTFLLTDYYYDNLPIMKGEILLGKNS